MDDQVVHAMDKGMGENNFLDFFYQIFLRSLTKERIDGILHSCDSGIENKDSHQNTEPAIQNQSCKLADNGCKKHQAGSGSIA